MPYSRDSHITRSLIYHVYNRGNGRAKIFRDHKDYCRFKEILQKYSRDKGLSIYHWVLMPNHYHLLLEIREPRKLSSVMAGIARAYIHYHHRKYSSAGHLFQGRFRSKPVEESEYLLNCGFYIEQNPCRAKMVKDIGDYEFSSYGYYVKGVEDGLTKTSPIYESFGLNEQERREKYAAAIKNYKNDYAEQIKWDSPLGAEKYKKCLIKEKGIFVPRRGRPIGPGVSL